jgi:multidrug transporter EmrE-like cation transporter
MHRQILPMPLFDPFTCPIQATSNVLICVTSHFAVVLPDVLPERSSTAADSWKDTQMTPATYGFLWCALAALASALATFLIKMSNGHGADLNVVRLAFLGGAGTTYALGFVCYSVALQKLDISVAYPIMTGIAMLMVAILGTAVLGESITFGKIVGMVLIAAGAFALVR